MSCSLTTRQVRERIKLVTRRNGWKDLKVGERLQLCEKCMGRRKGEALVKLAVVEVVDVRREPLRRLTDDTEYGFVETVLEGFKGLPQEWPSVFVEFFCASHKGVTPDSVVTRIEWRYV